jgi:hypothetical protein
MSIYRSQQRLLVTHVRYWPLTKIVSSTAPVRIRGLSRYQLCGGPFSLHMSAFDPKRTWQCFSSAVTKGCHAVLRLHLQLSIDKEVVEIVNANEPEPRIFHVCQSVERDR